MKNINSEKLKGKSPNLVSLPFFADFNLPKQGIFT